ncbi:hypothetical protein [Mucilaginibacter antarcticus]|uniref:hypothetical protein n=1 Tax=Mucilaginibacter antarcticus TaxID=1855725 RepID=UPI0036455B2B
MPHRTYPYTFNAVLVSFVIFLSAFTNPQDSVAQGAFKFKTVVIDAGHGVKTRVHMGCMQTKKP